MATMEKAEAIGFVVTMFVGLVLLTIIMVTASPGTGACCTVALGFIP